MKKSVVILIALIYVASIALVGFLGLKAKSYNDIVYPQSVEILNSYTIDSRTGNKSINFKPANREDKILKLECRIVPDNANNKKIFYDILSGDKYATIDENGLITFSDNISTYKTITVLIYSAQDSLVSERIDITYIPPAS